MTRRSFFAALVPALTFRLHGENAPGLSIRGKLVQADEHPLLEPEHGKRIPLHGDGPTMGVLNDKRLANLDLEALGHYAQPNLFEVNPIHTRALFVHKAEKKLLITYWCDVCYIRTYSPGVCWCCQKYTDLDLREPSELNSP